MINKETYERLKPYYIHLRRGYKGNYVFGLLQKDFDVLYEIYKALEDVKTYVTLVPAVV